MKIGQLSCVVLGIALILMSGCDTNTGPANVVVAPSATTTAPAVFDIPFLLRQSVAQVKAKLGPPVEELQANVTDTERSLVYKKQGLVLTVDYFVDTQKVDVISLAGERDTTAFQHLLPLGNLSPTGLAYTIDTLRSEKPGLYRGIVVRTNPPVEFPTP